MELLLSRNLISNGGDQTVVISGRHRYGGRFFEICRQVNMDLEDLEKQTFKGLTNVLYAEHTDGLNVESIIVYKGILYYITFLQTDETYNIAVNFAYNKRFYNPKFKEKDAVKAHILREYGYQNQ